MSEWARATILLSAWIPSILEMVGGVASQCRVKTHDPRQPVGDASNGLESPKISGSPEYRDRFHLAVTQLQEFVLWLHGTRGEDSSYLGQPLVGFSAEPIKECTIHQITKQDMIWKQADEAFEGGLQLIFAQIHADTFDDRYHEAVSYTHLDVYKRQPLESPVLNAAESRGLEPARAANSFGPWGWS